MVGILSISIIGQVTRLYKRDLSPRSLKALPIDIVINMILLLWATWLLAKNNL
jgi:hypothetical protein